MSYRDVAIIQKEEKIDNGDFGDEYEWNDILAIACQPVSLSTEMQVEYEQIGHSNVSLELMFPYEIKINISEHRIKYKDEIYEIVSPPANRGRAKKVSKVAIRKVTENGG